MGTSAYCRGEHVFSSLAKTSELFTNSQLLCTKLFNPVARNTARIRVLVGAGFTLSSSRVFIRLRCPEMGIAHRTIDHSFPHLEHLSMDVDNRAALTDPFSPLSGLNNLRSFIFGCPTAFRLDACLDFLCRIGTKECVYEGRDGEGGLTLVVKTLKS